MTAKNIFSQMSRSGYTSTYVIYEYVCICLGIVTYVQCNYVMQYNVNNDTIRLVVKPNLNVSSTINVQVATKVISRFTFGFVVRYLIECP